jgi:flagellar assembly protein FliH
MSLNEGLITMTNNYTPWELPDIDSGKKKPEKNLVTAEEIESLQKQAYEEGFRKGEQDGLQAGQKQIMERVNAFNQMMNALSTPIKQVDEEVSDQIVKLAITIAQQLVRREIKTDPGQIIAVVRDAVKELPVTARAVSVHLQPDDAELVRQSLSVNDSDKTWKVVEDPVLTRGGCKIVTENSQIDVTVEKQLAEIVSRLLGGQREGESGER